MSFASPGFNQHWLVSQVAPNPRSALVITWACVGTILQPNLQLPFQPGPTSPCYGFPKRWDCLFEQPSYGFPRQDAHLRPMINKILCYGFLQVPKGVGPCLKDLQTRIITLTSIACVGGNLEDQFPLSGTLCQVL